MKIASKSQHRRYLEVLGGLMKEPMSPRKAARAVRLAKAIEEFEKERYPIADPTPEEAAAFRKAEEPKKT